MNSIDRSKTIYEVLKKSLKKPDFPKTFRDPFQALIVTIISQNTNDRNAVRAYRELEARGLINVKNILSVDVEELEEALKPAGLYRVKARRLKELASIILERYEGDLSEVLKLPLEEARKLLLELPGVGFKTADVLLLFCSNKPVIPIDTHVNRTSKRLGLVEPKANYEEVRITLEKLYPPELYLDIHLLLISLGRSFCKAAKPLCERCPLRRLCLTSLRTEAKASSS